MWILLLLVTMIDGVSSSRNVKIYMKMTHYPYLSNKKVRFILLRNLSQFHEKENIHTHTNAHKYKILDSRVAIVETERLTVNNWMNASQHNFTTWWIQLNFLDWKTVFFLNFYKVNCGPWTVRILINHFRVAKIALKMPIFVRSITENSQLRAITVNKFN